MGEDALVADKFAELARFARILESSELSPRALVYATYPDTGDERLLVVPEPIKFDERDIYRAISILLSHRRDDFRSIEISDIRIVSDTEPYIRGLASLFRVEGFSTMTIEKSVLSGVYIEHVVVFKMAL